MPVLSPTSRRLPAEEIATLRALWEAQKEFVATHGQLDAYMDYLSAHFTMTIALQRRLAVVDQISPYIQGRVLEWGCRHGFDSCVYRMRFGDEVELHGCDVDEPGTYRPFHEFSGLRYARLRHHYLLDYDDANFDVVTSDGVLEHVPDDANSAREICRILKPGGTFVVTCLPNRLSYTEAFQRLRKGPAHDRLYSVASAKALLAGAGFRVVASRHFFMLPTMLNGFPARLKAIYQRAHRAVWAANAALERLWPINRLASNLFLVAVKPSTASQGGDAVVSG